MLERKSCWYYVVVDGNRLPKKLINLCWRNYDKTLVQYFKNNETIYSSSFCFCLCRENVDDLEKTSIESEVYDVDGDEPDVELDIEQDSTPSIATDNAAGSCENEKVHNFL